MGQNKKKITVLSKLVINEYLVRDEELEDSIEYRTYLLANPNDSILLTNTKDISYKYNDYGNLTSIHTVSTKLSYDTEIKQGYQKLIETIKLNDQQLIEDIKIEEHSDIKTTKQLSYKNNLLKQVKTTESSVLRPEYFILNYEYNNKQLVGTISVEHSKHNQPPYFFKIACNYNANGALKSFTSKDTTLEFSYDKAKNPFAHLKTFYTDILNQELLFPLLHTNYKQQNNITQITNGDKLIIYKYTYNNDNLPIKAIVKDYYTPNMSEPYSFIQYEYFYKDLEITE
ncbi:hypothetical protein AV926_04680 [Myroides marinus]|uniref:Uncharacterized protein n=1 Tax=Myroides marinus TaxID=703342 RepID=A0A164ACU0_9FLAO|nr:hypothetical protein AV926_04680 [Myroides marinus]